MIDEYMKKYEVRLNLRMEREMQDRVAQAAFKLNMSQAQFIRLSLESQLNKSLKKLQDEFYTREL